MICRLNIRMVKRMRTYQDHKKKKNQIQISIYENRKAFLQSSNSNQLRTKHNMQHELPAPFVRIEKHFHNHQIQIS